MEEKALKLWQLYTQQPKLWEGWDHGSTPIGFHDCENAVLFGHPNPSQEFTEKEREGVKYHIANPKPVSFTANTAVDLNGVATATIMWQEREEEEMLGLITHEAFHAYQMATACPWGNISVVLKYPVSEPLVQALAEIEGSMLYQAVGGGGGEEIVRAALDARAARQALLSAEVATFEDETELGEGLATYVEIKTAGLGSQLWQGKLNLLQKINRNGWGADRLRFYYSGMAWALLCDRYAPDWQRGEWRPLVNIVAEAIGHVPNTKEREYPTLDFDMVLAKHELEAAAREEAMKKSLAQALPGTGLRVEIFVKGNPGGAGWNPSTVVTYPGFGRFHSTRLFYYYDSGTKIDIGKDCLEKQNSLHVVFERPQLELLLDGSPLSPGNHQGNLKITSGDCIVSIPLAKVRLEGNCLIAEEILA